MRKPLRFIVTGRDQGIRVRVVYRMQGAAMRYAKMITEVEVYDILENKYVYGTTKICRLLLGNQGINFAKEDEMKVSRYRVEGLKDGIPSMSMFKNKAAAMKFAEKLKDVEVYDTITREYLYGTSKFYHSLQRQKLESLFVQ